MYGILGLHVPEKSTINAGKYTVHGSYRYYVGVFFGFSSPKTPGGYIHLSSIWKETCGTHGSPMFNTFLSGIYVEDV